MDNRNFTDEEMTAARRAYYKAWRQKHKEKVKEYNRRFWKRCAEKTLENQQMKPKEGNR